MAVHDSEIDAYICQTWSACRKVRALVDVNVVRAELVYFYHVMRTFTTALKGLNRATYQTG